jgi:hypothetical protein
MMMIDLDSDLLILCSEFHVTDCSWKGKAKNVLGEFIVFHLGFISQKFLPLHTQNLDGPISQMGATQVNPASSSHQSASPTTTTYVMQY